MYVEPLVAFNDFPSDLPLYEATYDKGLSWAIWDPFAEPGRRLRGQSWGDPKIGRWIFIDGQLQVVEAGKLTPAGGA